jgi:hypothetical protein
MAEANDTNGGEWNSAATGDKPDNVPAGGAARMWISASVFLVLAVITFFAGEDNRWVSIPAAVVAAVALIDFLSVNQRRRHTTSE